MLKEVTVTLNRGVWSNSGVFYDGCVMMQSNIYQAFIGFLNDYLQQLEKEPFVIENIMKTYELKDLELQENELSGHNCFYMTKLLKDKLIEFFQENQILFDSKKMNGECRYYIEVRS